jgi:phosphatidate cytidylyltransferase
MNKELTTRIITSLFLIGLLTLTFFYSYILIISLIIISLVSWVEFQGLITKIIYKKKINSIFLRFLIKALSLIYLTIFSFMVFSGVYQDNNNLNILFLFSICICSDVGGLFFGKIFKGKKLTKISPKKTISGSIGSFILSLFMVPIFIFLITEKINIFYDLIIIAVLVSFSCQVGDLFISYLKRRAKVKDTGDLLPGHGGILDRIDGMLFAIPVGLSLCKFLAVNL